MPLGTTFWGVVLPVGKTNLALNPSAERGTSGVAAIAGASIGSAASDQTFGAWSFSVQPGANGTSGAAFGTFTATFTESYTISAYVKGAAGVGYRMAVGDSNGLNFVGSTTFTGGGTWHRYALSYTETPGAVRRPVITKVSGADSRVIYVDGWQFESGSLTTYIDGDQDGCYWQGAPHASPSVRSGTYRGGGSVVALADLGFTVEQSLGIGMPPLDTTAQSFALADGAEFQRQRAEARTFTLAARMQGTTWRDLHITRRTVIDALKIDLVAPQQPTRFWYIGGEGTVQIDAVLDAGLEMGKVEGFTEYAAPRFIAHDPFWYSTTDQGGTLPSRANLGSTNFIVKRSPAGVWGTLGFEGSVVNGTVRALALGPDNTLYFGGSFTDIGGTTFPHIGQYNPTTNRFGTLTGAGTVGGAVGVFALAVAPSGTLYLGGNLPSPIGGTATQYLAQWTPAGAFGTLTGGTVNLTVSALLWSAGTLFAGGVFTTAGGTSAPFVAAWVNSAWGTLTGGTVNGAVQALSTGLDSAIYLAGAMTNIAGTASKSIARWNGTMRAVGSGLNGVAPTAYSLTPTPDAQLYVGGAFGTADNGAVQGLAKWNGVQLTGAGSVGNVTPVHYALAQDPLTGDISIGVGAASGMLPYLDVVHHWNGAVRLPYDIQFPGVSAVYALALAPDRTLYAAGDFRGTAHAGAVVSVVNTGRTIAYPVLKIRNVGSGTARPIQFANLTTGDYLYFNLSLQPEEEAVLQLTPGRRTFRSSYRGNIFGAILGGSNLASWRLMPGTNDLSFFSDSDNLTVSCYWRPRHTSVDGGTVS